MTTGVAILGSTGSIGTQTIALLERFPDRFRVTALAAGRRAAELKLAGFEVSEAFLIYASFENSLSGKVKRKIVDIGRHLFRLGKTMPLNLVLVARKTGEQDTS